MVVERLKHIKPGENVWNAELPEHLRLNVPRTKLSHIYKRIDPDKPSYTVTEAGGGGTHMYHWDEPRALTNRERARLQTFPIGFNSPAQKKASRKQIGMAIPPEGMQIICEAILKTIYDVPYEFVEGKYESSGQPRSVKRPKLCSIQTKHWRSGSISEKSDAEF